MLCEGCVPGGTAEVPAVAPELKIVTFLKGCNGKSMTFSSRLLPTRPGAQNRAFVLFFASSWAKAAAEGDGDGDCDGHGGE